MKVKKEKEIYTPIQITLESESEYDAIHGCISEWLNEDKSTLMSQNHIEIIKNLKDKLSKFA